MLVTQTPYQLPTTATTPSKENHVPQMPLRHIFGGPNKRSRKGTGDRRSGDYSGRCRQGHEGNNHTKTVEETGPSGCDHTLTHGTPPQTHQKEQIPIDGISNHAATTSKTPCQQQHCVNNNTMSTTTLHQQQQQQCHGTNTNKEHHTNNNDNTMLP